MLQEEDQLARMLKNAVPMPPRTLSADRVEELAKEAHFGIRVRPRRIVRRWVPALLSATSVAALLIGLVVGVHSFVGSDGTRAPAASPTPTGVPSTPWATSALPGQLANTMVGTPTDLYTVYTTADSGAGVTTIKRLDPSTAKVSVDATIRGITDSYVPGQGQPVIAGGSLWITTGISASGTVTLRGLDLMSLHTVTDLTVPFSGITTGNHIAALSAAPDGTLYLGAGDSYISVNPANGHLGVRTTIQGGQIGGLAVAPDNSRVYVGISDNEFFTTFGSDTSLVQARQPLTGVLLGQAGGTTAAAGSSETLGGIQSMMASAGGVWVSNQSGPHGEIIRFLPTDLNLAQTVSPDGSTGGGGALAVATTAAGAVWLGGGNHGISCVDPSSGAIRATAVPKEQVTAVTFAGQNGFAIYTNSRNVARIRPPAACTP
jgi:hypothetical protein